MVERIFRQVSFKVFPCFLSRGFQHPCSIYQLLLPPLFLSIPLSVTHTIAHTLTQLQPRPPPTPTTVTLYLNTQSAEFCSEHDTWKLNVAHVFFMQENKFKEAIHYYEPIIAKHEDGIVEVTAIVLANLCVSYIMTSQNEKAEDLMRRIEREEEQIAPRTRQTVFPPLHCQFGHRYFTAPRVTSTSVFRGL